MLPLTDWGDEEDAFLFQATRPFHLLPDLSTSQAKIHQSSPDKTHLYNTPIISKKKKNRKYARTLRTPLTVQRRHDSEKEKEAEGIPIPIRESKSENFPMFNVKEKKKKQKRQFNADA